MKKNISYKGVIVPMVSPLKDDLTVDVEGVGRVVDGFLKYNVSPFVVGTTGEAGSLPIAQREDLVKATLARTKGKSTVYVGIASNCIADTIDMTKRFAGLGADVAVANVPSYYPLTDVQAAKYCEKLADACPIPLILYNITATTGYSMPLEIINKLSHHPNVVGLKDSERDVGRLDRALELWKSRDDFVYLLGWAAMSSYALINGADGIVPSTGNFAPELYAALYSAVANEDIREAKRLQATSDRLGALYQKARTLAESLAALKVVMNEKKLCGTQVMPPIYKMDGASEAAYRAEIKTFLRKYEML